MKLKKQIALILFAAMLTALAAGCGQGSNQTATAAPTTTTTAAPTTAATTAATTTKAAETTTAATTQAATTKAAAATTTAATTTAATTAATTTAAPAAPQKTTINVCIASSPDTIDPQLNTSVDGAMMIQHMFEGLIKWGDDGNGNAYLVPGQAESYERVTNADGTITYTFKLRDGIKWSDGKPVTAEDFVNGLRRLVNPATAADYSYMVDGIILNAHEILIPTNFEEIDATPEGAEPPEAVYAMQPEDLAVAAADEKTLTITIVNECPYFEELLAFPPLFPTRKDLIDAHGDQWATEPATYIGNGPYKMTAWERNSYIEISKNENHYEYASQLPEKIKFALMDDQNAILTAFRNGELDFIQSVPVNEVPGLLASGELTVVKYIGTYYMSFQVKKAPFDDARVREAFGLAIDRNFIVENITRTGQKPAGGFVPAGINDADPLGPDFRTVGGDWYSLDKADYEANCERARQLLADAGYPGGQGFPAVEYMYNTSDNHRAIAEALQADWERELGVTVTLANQDWAVFLQTRKQGNYQIARNGWIADYNDPISFLDMWVTNSGNNDAQYANPAFDALILQTRSITDPKERMKVLHEAENIMRDDFMLAPIYFYTQMYMLKPELSGLYYTPLGYFFFNHLK